MDDVELTFNPDNFLKGIKKINDSISNFEKESKTKFSSADKNSAKMSMSMMNAFGNLSKPMIDSISKMSMSMRNAFRNLNKPVIDSIAKMSMSMRNAFGNLSKPMIDSIAKMSMSMRNAFGNLSKPMIDSVVKMSMSMRNAFGNLSKPMIDSIAKMSMSMRNAFGNLSKPMIDSIAKMSALMEKFASSQKEKFESSQKEKSEKIKGEGDKMSSFMVAKGMIMANMLMGAFNKVFNFIKTGLPEIGRSMSIASGIIQRNLLWPLRKEMAPMLQKMLDWVRDHRAMFVRWGGALVNVFRAVTAVFQGFIKMFQALIAPIAEKMKSLFGGVAGGISEVFNIALFKITSVIMFLQTAFMPLVEQIGSVLSVMVGWVSDFFSGFTDGVAGIAEPLGDLITQLVELAKALSLGDEEVSLLGASFRTLGDFLGSTLYTILVATADMIDGMSTSIKKFSLSIQEMKAMAKGNFAEIAKLENQAKINELEYRIRSKKREGQLKDKWSGFADRTMANFSPNSNTSSKQINATSKVNIEKMEIKLGPGDDPKKAGEGFIEGMNKKNSQNFKNILLNEAGTQGYAP